jgi:2-(1,2-epoxy-1,2-dihydrophenyl)acetyl-CoA isomerase
MLFRVARLERDGVAAVVTLDRPETRNSLGPDEARELASMIRHAGSQPEIAGVVLTGEGAFCAGGNLRVLMGFVDGPEARLRDVVYDAYQGLVRALVATPVPTVAAVDGAAVGLGFDLALACDCCLVGPSGWARQGWGALGLVPGTGGELLLRRRAPAALWRLLATQPRLDASALEQLGLGERVGEGTALAAAVGRVEAMGAMSADALAAYVRLHRADLRRGLDEHLAACLDVQVGLLRSPEFRVRAQAALDA